jgi:hypothetical protein
VNVAVIQNELRNVPLADIHISVELGNRGSLDFTDITSIIDLGYQAAAQNEASLEKLSLPLQQWEEYVRTVKSREREVPPVGPLIGVSSPQASIQKNATYELFRKTGGRVSRSSLESNLSGLTAATGLPSAYYGWHSVAAGQSGYQVDLEPRRNTEILLRPSFFYQLSPDEPGRPTFRISGAAIFRDAYKSRLLSALYVGNDPALFVEYYRPFNGSAYFVAPGLSLDRVHYPIYNRQEHNDTLRDRFSGWLYFGIGTWRHLQLRMGVQAGFDRYGGPVVADDLVATDTGFANTQVTWIVNTQDSGQLPTRGFRMNGSTGWSFREHSFPYIQTNFDQFQPVGDRFSFTAHGQMDTSLGRKLTFYDKFTTGGLNQLNAYRYQEFRADTILEAGLGVLYRGANPNNEAFRPLLGCWYEAASVDSRDTDALFRQSATLGVLTPTPLGLASLTFSVDLKGSTRVRLSIGSFWNRP